MKSYLCLYMGWTSILMGGYISLYVYGDHGFGWKVPFWYGIALVVVGLYGVEVSRANPWSQGICTFPQSVYIANNEKGRSNTNQRLDPDPR